MFRLCCYATVNLHIKILFSFIMNRRSWSRCCQQVGSFSLYVSLNMFFISLSLAYCSFLHFIFSYEDYQYGEQGCLPGSNLCPSVGRLLRILSIAVNFVNKLTFSFCIGNVPFPVLCHWML